MNLSLFDIDGPDDSNESGEAATESNTSASTEKDIVTGMIFEV